jgi:hypothetical protein
LNSLAVSLEERFGVKNPGLGKPKVERSYLYDYCPPGTATETLTPAGPPMNFTPPHGEAAA